MEGTMRTKALALAAAVSLAPFTATADDGTMDDNALFSATFSLTATIGPNTEGTAYCGGSGLAVIAEGHGAGYSTRLGPITLFLQKTVDAPPGGNMHGCLTLTSAVDSKSSVQFTYDGTWGDINANNFADASGNLTVTKATGRFYGLKSLVVPFTASFYISAESVVSAYYAVQ
jgi:hypothetical protein